VPVKVKSAPTAEHEPETNLASTSNPWIWMVLTVGPVAVHGSLVAVTLTAQPAPRTSVPKHPSKVALVTVRTAALRTSTVSCAALQLHPIPDDGMKVEKPDVSRVCSEPTNPQLAADAAGDVTNAANDHAPANAKTIATDSLLNISKLPCEPPTLG
jgi:hypothetical protein